SKTLRTASGFTFLEAGILEDDHSASAESIEFQKVIELQRFKMRSPCPEGERVGERAVSPLT
ncbi:MAG: hypothetical protein Q8K32_04015, partial [Archangium sp.]|nr:hypothetical protein [Archangium sp.]